MEKLGTSILIVCLDEEIGNKLSQQFADFLGLHFACCKEIIEYDLFDSGAILQKCGIDYLNKREKSVMNNISHYENSVIFMNFDLYQNNISLFENLHPSIYLNLPKKKLSKKETINSISYETRSAFLIEKCDLMVEIGGANKNALTKLVKEVSNKL